MTNTFIFPALYQVYLTEICKSCLTFFCSLHFSVKVIQLLMKKIAFTHNTENFCLKQFSNRD